MHALPMLARRITASGVLALTAALIAPPMAVQAQDQEVAEALRRLQALEGSWKAERVEFLNEDGEVFRVSTAEAHNEVRFNGNLVVHRGRLHDPEIQTQGWYYWDPHGERLHLSLVASDGGYDEFVGGWRGNRLVIEMLPSPAFPDRAFRMSQSEITENSFLETIETSTDGGETWRVSSRQRMRRVGSVNAAAEILEAMDDYTGHWRTEEKTDQNENAFHFEYELRWMDEGRTIARIHITRVGADGSRGTVFEGYKGREPDGGSVYYHGASPSGRGARGEVVLEGEELVTRYEGWSADGNPVRIRDVFDPVHDGTFESRTFLKASPDSDWRRIGVDRWTKVGPPR